MTREQSEAPRAASKQAELANLYRAIGPAAIAAALLCAPKKEEAAAKLGKAA